jgi:hypothetical protein
MRKLPHNQTLVRCCSLGRPNPRPVWPNATAAKLESLAVILMILEANHDANIKDIEQTPIDRLDVPDG